MQVKLNIPDDVYEKIKEQAKTDLRTANQEIIYILRCHVNHTIPQPQYIPPSVYIPAPVTTVATPENPTAAPIVTAQQISTMTAPDISSMNGLELQEYARKLSAEAKTKITQEKQEAREEAKQLTPEEEQIKAQKLELQKQKLQEKRERAIRDRAIELDLYGAEDYTEERVLFEIYDADYVNSKFDGTQDQYLNKPLEEVYALMDKIKAREDKEEAEQKRREALPHDVDEWDYKSEDFEDDLRREENYNELSKDPDYMRIREYYISHCYYNRFIRLLRYPYNFCRELSSPEVDYDQEYKAMQNAFNREKIDEDYIVALFYGNGEQYREEHKALSYSQEIENERKEMEALLKSKPRKSIIG